MTVPDFDSIFSDLLEDDNVFLPFLQSLREQLPEGVFQVHTAAGAIIPASAPLALGPEITEHVLQLAAGKPALVSTALAGGDKLYGIAIPEMAAVLLCKLPDAARDSQSTSALTDKLLQHSIELVLLQSRYRELLTENQQATRQLSVLHNKYGEQIETNYRHYEILREKEAELRAANEQLKEYSRLKSEFLANMSHEIRTPLNGIIGMIELCLDMGLGEEPKKMLEIANTEASSLLLLLTEVLDMSKIEAGKLELEKTVFDLRYLFENTVKSFSVQALKKDVHLHHVLTGDTPARLFGDPGRLRQILINLISNALKFTPAGGRVDVRGELLEELSSDAAQFRFSVADSGIGIRKEKLGLIFESFCQADGSTTRKFGGTGLGTTISKQLVELMGGEIGVESDGRSGSTFWFTVALEKPQDRPVAHSGTEDGLTEQKSAARPNTSHLPGQTLSREFRILLVEDYPTNQIVVLRHLRNAGYQVDLAVDGKQAVEMYAQQCYNVVLMDIQMPVMDGYQATIAIRDLEKHTGARALIIAMTANALKEDKEKCLACGMDDYLSKPLKKDDFLEALGKWVAKLTACEREQLAPPSEGEKAPDSVAGNAPMNFAQALAEFEGDREFLREVITGFLENAGGQLAAIRQAIACGDAETVRREAHAIKGGAANLTAEALAGVAFELEKVGKSGKLDPAGQILEQLEQEFRRLQHYVNDIR